MTGLCVDVQAFILVPLSWARAPQVESRYGMKTIVSSCQGYFNAENMDLCALVQHSKHSCMHMGAAVKATWPQRD